MISTLFMILIVFTMLFSLFLARKQVSSVIIGLPLVVVLAILSSFTSSSIQDYTNYFYDYLYYSNSTFEIGYRFFAKLSNLHGLLYSDFKVITALCAMTIFIIAIMRMTRNFSLYIVCYAFFPFIFDTIQTRNFLMVAFVTLGYSFLLNKSKKNLVISLFFVFIGALFHSLGYVFIFPILIFYFFNNKKGIRLIGALCILASIVLFSSTIQNLIISMLSYSSVTTAFVKLARYSGSTRGWGFLFDWLRIILTFIVILVLRESTSENEGCLEKKRSRDINLINLAFAISTISMVTLPLIINNANFERVYRDGFPIMSLAILATLKYTRKFSFKWIFLIFIFIIIMLLNVYTMLLATHSSIYPIFYQNTLFN